MKSRKSFREDPQVLNLIAWKY